MSAPCTRPECGGEIHTDGWGTPTRCPHEDPPQCTASIASEFGDGIVQCVLPAGHEDPEQGPAHLGPGDPFTRLRWFDWAPGATPHREGAAHDEAPASEVDQLRADVESLRYQIRRAREALATDEPLTDDAAAVSRVRALHREEFGCCSHCTRADAVPYPCPTIRALNGEAL